MRANRAETRTAVDAVDLLCQAISLNELAFLAVDGIPDQRVKGAFATGLDRIDDILREVKAILDAENQRTGVVA